MGSCDCERMAKIEQIVYGNGGDGISKKVEEHDELIHQLKGMLKALKIYLVILGSITCVAGIRFIPDTISFLLKVF